MVNVTFNRTVDSNELKEVMSLLEVQETADRYENTILNINGEYAVIDVEIDDMGDVTVLQHLQKK